MDLSLPKPRFDFVGTWFTTLSVDEDVVVPVTSGQPAPYAPASAILELVERHRNKGLPTPVNSDVLERASISPSLIPRTLQALQTLDLIDGDGRPTAILEGIRVAPTAEYQQRLGEWLNGAYADALQYVDPGADDEIKIRDAFRSYNPVGQQSRMVTLFLGLFAAAGIRADKPKPAGRITSSPGASKPTSRPATRTLKPAQQQVTPPGHSGNSSLPPALAGLLSSLPPAGQSWPKAERDRFLLTFGAVLDFCFPIEGTRKSKQPQDDMQGADID